MKLAAPLFLFAALLALVPASYAQAPPATPRAITIDDYFQIRDVADPQLSPDAKWVAYSVTSSLKDDKSESRIWMVPTAGGDSIAMTAEGGSSSHPRWSPDGKFLAFLSARNEGKTYERAFKVLTGVDGEIEVIAR
jgi:Tol biopolymer transport system component